MTRVSGLPEPRHKSQLCFSESHLWFLVKNPAGALTLETNHESSILGRKITSRASVAQGLTVYIYVWSIGDLWGKRSMSGRVAWNSQRRGREQAQSPHKNEWKVSAKSPIQAIMKECVLKCSVLEAVLGSAHEILEIASLDSKQQLCGSSGIRNPC